MDITIRWIQNLESGLIKTPLGVFSVVIMEKEDKELHYNLS